MAPGRQTFALVGYSEDLEKRPLKFADPIPPSRICSASGYIPRMTNTLMCGHTFCDSCYESCPTASECVCPLDGDVCDRDGVVRIEYPAEQLLRRKAHCWNEGNGCGVVLPASQIADHVRADCQHHVTHCPKCSAVVLCHDVCAHLRSRCAALALRVAPEPQQGTDGNEIPYLLAFERRVEQRVGEIDAKLARLSLESGLQSDKLAEICHNINHLNEALKEQSSPTVVQTLHHLVQNEAKMKALIANDQTIQQKVGDLDDKIAQLSLNCASMSDQLVQVCSSNIHLKEALTEQLGPALDRKAADLKALCDEKIEYLRTTFNSQLAMVRRESTTDQRVMTGYAALKEEAAKEGYSYSESDRVYLHRYLMSWGFEFKKEGESVFIALDFQLHEGIEDEFCEWPFRKELKLSIIHPETRQERLLHGKPITNKSTMKFYGRPIEVSNEAVVFNNSKVNIIDIERDGYVKQDQLLLRFEVL